MASNLNASDAASIERAQQVPRKTSLRNGLAYLRASFRWLPAKLLELERMNEPPTAALSVFKNMLLSLRAAEGPCGVRVQSKTDAVIRRNPDLGKLAKITAVLGGAADMNTLEDLSPADIASLHR